MSEDDWPQTHTNGKGQMSDVRCHPGEMRSAVVNEFHPSTIVPTYGAGRAGRSKQRDGWDVMCIGRRIIEHLKAGITD